MVAVVRAAGKAAGPNTTDRQPHGGGGGGGAPGLPARARSDEVRLPACWSVRAVQEFSCVRHGRRSKGKAAGWEVDELRVESDWLVLE